MGKSRNNSPGLSGQLFLSNGETKITAKKGAKEPSRISLLFSLSSHQCYVTTIKENGISRNLKMSFTVNDFNKLKKDKQLR